MVYYSIFNGRNPGVYTSWEEAKKQIHGFPKAKFKKFNTEHEAHQYVKFGDLKVQNVNGFLVSTNTQKEIQQHTEILAHRPSLKRSRKEFDSNSTHDLPSSKFQKVESNPIRSVNSAHDLSDLNSNTNLDSNTNLIAIENTNVFRIFTDGSFVKKMEWKEGVGGYGVYFEQLPSESISMAAHQISNLIGVEVTSQRMELMAILCAYEWIEKNMDKIREKKVTVYTDSNYAYRTFAKDRWIEKWKKNGWWTTSGEKVKNQDLMTFIDTLYSKLNIPLVKVPAHKGIFGNEQVDKLAKKGSSKHLEFKIQQGLFTLK